MKWDEINLRYTIYLILTLSATSSEIERGFSQMKLIKTNIRSKLSIENKNLMTIKMLTTEKNDSG